YTAEITDESGQKIFSGRVKDISRHGVRLKGLLDVESIEERVCVNVMILVEDADPLKPSEVVHLTGRVRRARFDYDAVDVAIVFDSPFKLKTPGRFREMFQKVVSACFTEKPKY
ncbi:MAG: PilZ domain-containing protein, partial [Phycisphaerae bacterium]|nr:PilZ domain-containing protein [Phycisphaerae bacterium]